MGLKEVSLRLEQKVRERRAANIKVEVIPCEMRTGCIVRAHGIIWEEEYVKEEDMKDE